MESLIFPFMNHIGILWQAGTVNPGFEHFISNIIKTRIITATEELENGSLGPDAKKFVLFLPDGEDHEIGLLIRELSSQKGRP